MTTGGAGGRVTVQTDGAQAGPVELPPTAMPRDAAGGDSMAVVGPLPGGTPDGGVAPHPSDVVFDETKLSEWRVIITAADLKKLNDTAVMEIPVPATLTVNGEDVGQVGIRYKGAYGSFRTFCFSSGVNVCKKLSYKIDFAEYKADKRFYGLKKVNLHAQMRDGTQLHERLAYKMYRQSGVPTARSVHAKVFINGAYKGLFALTEAIDSRFVKKWWPGAGEGNLYKETWPLLSDPKYYVKGQKTNEPDPASATKKVVPPTKILAFQKALYAASPADLPKVVDSWMNMDYMLKLAAIDNAIMNWDSPLTFYCQPKCTTCVPICNNHNHFIYESETDNRLWVIPWDLDDTFSPTDDRETGYITAWDKPPGDCTRYFMQNPGSRLQHPGCDRVYRGMAGAGRARYVAAINQFLAGAFNPDRMRQDIDVWAAQISEAVRMDGNGPGFAAWQANVTRFKSDLDKLRTKIINIRDAKP